MAENEMTVLDDGGGGELLIPGSAPLTPREEQFCVAFGDPESTTYGRSEKSATVAGYVQPRSAAWKLRRRPKIQARLAEFQKVTAAAAGKVMSDLEHIRLLAIEKNDLATAARCAELAGKRLGLFRDVLAVDDLDARLAYNEREAIEVRKITALLLQNPQAFTDATPALPAPKSAVVPQPALPARARPAEIIALEQVRNKKGD